MKTEGYARIAVVKEIVQKKIIFMKIFKIKKIIEAGRRLSVDSCKYGN